MIHNDVQWIPIEVVSTSTLQVLKMMVGKNLSEGQLQQIVDKTIVYLDKDQDGKISFEEFKLLVDKKGAVADITSMMKVEGI